MKNLHELLEVRDAETMKLKYLVFNFGIDFFTGNWFTFSLVLEKHKSLNKQLKQTGETGLQIVDPKSIIAWL